MQKYHPDLAVFELIMFLILVLVQKLATRKRAAASVNLVDQGPWWSVLYHRVWLACHIIPIFVSIAITSAAKAVRLKRELGLPLILFPVVNYVAIVFALNA